MLATIAITKLTIGPAKVMSIFFISLFLQLLFICLNLALKPKGKIWIFLGLNPNAKPIRIWDNSCIITKKINCTYSFIFLVKTKMNKNIKNSMLVVTLIFFTFFILKI